MVHCYDSSVVRRNKFLIHATVWVNLKIRMLSKRSAYCRIPFIQNSRKCKVTYRLRKQIIGCLGIRRRRSRRGGLQRDMGNLEAWWTRSSFHLDCGIGFMSVYIFNIVQFKYMQFIVCPFYINKAIKNNFKSYL